MKCQNNDCLILTDCPTDDILDFKKALEENTNYTWKAEAIVSNGERTFSTNLKRLISYFRAGFRAFRKRNKYKYIICWQQFFGVIYSFFCNLFFIKNSHKVIVMTFIYKRKKGFLGTVYHKFVKFALKNDNIIFLTTSSQIECKTYAELFNISEKKFRFMQWSRNRSEFFDQVEKGDYLISIGRSNRDFKFLEDALKDYNKKTYIYSDLEKKRTVGNVIYTGTVKDADLMMAKSFCVLVSIENPEISAGQTLLINAMSMKKPIISTRSVGLTDDYMKDKESGLIINKTKEELLNALDYLENEDNYKEISENAYKNWEDNYSIYKMGLRMVELFNEFGLI